MDTITQTTWMLNVPDETPFSVYLENERLDVLYKCLDKLHDREKRVVCMRFGLCGYERHTFRKIGEMIGRTHQTAKNVYSQALRSLKEMILEEDSPKTPDIDQKHIAYIPPTASEIEHANLERVKKQEMDRIASQRRFDDFVDNVRWYLYIEILDIISDSIKLLRNRWIPTEAYPILVKCHHPCCQRRDIVLIPYARVQDQIEYLSKLMYISNLYQLSRSYRYAHWNAYCFNVCGGDNYRAHMIASIFMDFKKKNFQGMNIPDWQYMEYPYGKQVEKEYNQAREWFKHEFENELQLFYTKPMFKIEDEVVIPIFEKLFNRKP